jgi:two-component system OmpR family sensor kinase
MLLLLIAAIVTADVVTSSSLRSFLIGRLDEQIDVAQAQAYTYIYETNHRDVLDHEALATADPRIWLAQLASAKDPSCSPTGASSASGRSAGVASSASAVGSAARTPRLNGFTLASLMNPDVYAEVVDASGRVVFNDPSGSCAHPDPAPNLPAHLPVQALPLSHVFGRNHGSYVPDRPSFDVSAVREAGVHYRAQAVAVPGGTLVTAIALAPTDQTLASVEHVELVVSIVVVLALLVLVLWIVRFGLRPLEDMTETAGAIAGGDLTRRIRSTDQHSEVGRLGAALNGMLSQIEAAFEERAVSESRLRRFVADASHELRTPLTSIRGYAELLRKGAFNDEDARRRATERIEHEAARMSLLVDDLLLLARLDQGRPLERFPVDVAEVVGDAVDAALAVNPERPISLDSRGDVIVEGDAVRLRQIVDNLLRNAEVHTPPGTPVHLRVTRVGSSVVIEVTDEGPGLDPEEEARVFDRFYRGSEARTGGGSGLGLSIVAALANAHGGRALVNSEPGRGTTFTIELPALERSPGEGARSRPGGERGPGGKAPEERVTPDPGVGSVRR